MYIPSQSFSFKYRIIRLHVDVLVRTSFGCFDSSIDQPFTTSHGVEVELRGGKTGKVRVLHESSRLRPVVVLNEVGQSSVSETKWNSLSFNVLLTYTGDNLK